MRKRTRGAEEAQTGDKSCPDAEVAEGGSNEVKTQRKDISLIPSVASNTTAHAETPSFIEYMSKDPQAASVLLNEKLAADANKALEKASIVIAPSIISETVPTVAIPNQSFELHKSVATAAAVTAAAAAAAFSSVSGEGQSSFSDDAASVCASGTQSSAQEVAERQLSIDDSLIPMSEVDPCGPPRIQDRMAAVVESWSKSCLRAINPEEFLSTILTNRGLSAKKIPSPASRSAPTPQQMKDYDVEFLQAVRNSDLAKIKALHRQGRTMLACNIYSESMIHMACRRSDLTTVNYILSHGADLRGIDDFGRTPLHDACWRATPRFDIVTLLLDIDPDLILTVDIRGSTPLSYVRKEHWLQWCAFLFHQKDRYWSVMPPVSTDSAEAASKQPLLEVPLDLMATD